MTKERTRRNRGRRRDRRQVGPYAEDFNNTSNADGGGAWDRWIDRKREKDEREAEREVRWDRWRNGQKSETRRVEDALREVMRHTSDLDDGAGDEEEEEEAPSDISSESTPSVTGLQACVGAGEGSVRSSIDDYDASSLGFGVIVYDLETIHNAERGTYAAKNMHECQSHEQYTWKNASQIIEFAAVDLLTGAELCVKSRPDFHWSDVRSPAARAFAEDHGHDKIVQDESLPLFREVWINEILPFLQNAAGASKTLAIIAHNGDQFDHWVLEKELARLGLMDALQTLVLSKFDPIRTLKTAFGQEFGSGGLLTLGAIHSRHVPAQQKEQPLHQALSDCNMLLEVITHWMALRVLLATEMCVALADMDRREEMCTSLISVLASRGSASSCGRDLAALGVRGPSSAVEPPLVSQQPRASGQQPVVERTAPVAHEGDAAGSDTRASPSKADRPPHRKSREHRLSAEEPRPSVASKDGSEPAHDRFYRDRERRHRGGRRRRSGYNPEKSDKKDKDSDVMPERVEKKGRDHDTAREKYGEESKASAAKASSSVQFQ